MKFSIFQKSLLAGFIILALFFTPCCSKKETVCISLANAALAAGFKENEISKLRGNITYFEDKLTPVQVKFQDSTASLEFPVSKNQIFPVLVTYTECNGYTFKRTGLFYPFSQEFSVQGAFCSCVYMRLFASSTESPEQIEKFLSYFNWKKFYEKVKECDDPFVSLDLNKICRDIANSKFKNL